MYAYPSLITTLALFVYLFLTVNVSRARTKYKIPPPGTTGDPTFERILRVQNNTSEQLIIFLPLLWIFSIYIDPIWGAIVGAIWIVGRILFAWGYYQAAEKRIIGFAINSLSLTVLLFGSLIGVGLEIYRTQF
jgi:uncharacterized membrane protein YecN with MAPEG domain